MIGTIITTRATRATAGAFRSSTAALLRWKAARSAQRAEARTGAPLQIVKEVLVVSPGELAALERNPTYLTAVERAHALHSAGELASCGTCAGYLLPDEKGGAHAA